MAPLDPTVDLERNDFPSQAAPRPTNTPQFTPVPDETVIRRVTPRPEDRGLSLAEIKRRMDAARNAVMAATNDPRTPREIQDAAFAEFEYWGTYYNQRVAEENARSGYRPR